METSYTVFSPDCLTEIGYVFVPKNEDPAAEAAMALRKAVNQFNAHVAVSPSGSNVQ